ncbi:MAG: magnesium chelatase subunit D family protein [Deltaproteobacteria bacterium]|nr:magnesium chelatase subunit D family protein [Deltaproteobacteria bacterium]
MTPKRPVFPFAALVGQERLKKALILNAVNPLIGGVLIRGEKGTAKSTAARGLAELLPPIPMVAGCPYHCDPEKLELMCDACRRRQAQGEVLPRRDRPMPVVDLPLGTTEDRLLGTIDIERAIKSGEKHFEPGLLAAANRGILYVDEVNLLDDHLVDVLLDAAAMGVNVVEREGISFIHPARFILVGTMNPEEGELRPQLLDRFGLCVEVTGLHNLQARMDVVARRLDFEADPEEFAARWLGEQEALRQAILTARELLPRVGYGADTLRLITAICLDQGVDGHRADIYMLKVARTLAAYRGRLAVADPDVREAAELVLPHRLRRQPFSDSEMDENKLEETFRKHQEEMEQRRLAQPQPEPGAPAGDPDEVQLIGETTVAPGATFPVKPLDMAPERKTQKAPGHRTRAKSDDRTGRYVRPSLHQTGPSDLALDATIRAAAPFQMVREKGNLALAICEPDWRYKVREKRIGRHILFVVDASGSMGADVRMVETKAAILSLLIDAYQRRERVGLIIFRGREARLTLPFTHSVEMAQRHLTLLPTGGKTPLPHALKLALEVLKQEKVRHPQDVFLLVLVTDGRANISLGARGPMAEVKELSAQIKTLGVNSLILDTEAFAPCLDLGCLPELSRIMGGSYHSLTSIRAPEMVARVEAALR